MDFSEKTPFPKDPFFRSRPNSLPNSREINRKGSDPFLRRFREGITFPNFVERSTLKLPLSKLCAGPFALQNRAPFEAEKRAKRCREKGGRGVASKGSKKEKRTRENGSAINSLRRFGVKDCVLFPNRDKTGWCNFPGNYAF